MSRTRAAFDSVAPLAALLAIQQAMFPASLGVGGTIFNANDIVTMMSVPLTLVLLALFLGRSTVGIALVPAAERADRASSLGIPVRRLHPNHPPGVGCRSLRTISQLPTSLAVCR